MKTSNFYIKINLKSLENYNNDLFVVNNSYGQK